MAGFFKKNLIISLNRDTLKGFLFLIFSFINKGVAFILLIILANCVTPAEYGKLSLFNTYLMLVGIIICLSTNGYVSVAYFRKKRDEFSKVISIISSIALIMLFLLSTILLLFSTPISHLSGVQPIYMGGGLCIAFFQIFFYLHIDILRIKEKIINYGIYSCSYAICNFILAILFVVGLHKSWYGCVYAQFIVAFLFFCISLFIFHKQGYFTKKIIKKSIWKEIIIWGLPIIPHLATGWIKQGMDRYIINYSLTITDVGLFSFILNIANIITIVGTAFNASHSVFIYKNLANGYSEETYTKLKKQTLNLLYIYLAVTLLVIVGALIGIPLIFAKYKQGIPYLFPLCIASLMQCIYWLYCNYLFYYNRTKQLMYITFFTSIIHLLLSLWLTRYGLIFTSIITLLSGMLMTFGTYWMSKRELKRSFIKNS